jgi:hypothetical protein
LARCLPWPRRLGGAAGRSELLRVFHTLARGAFAAEFFLAYVVCCFYLDVNSG